MTGSVHTGAVFAVSSGLPRAQVLVKAMTLLEVLLDGRPRPVAELARLTGINRSTAHRLLATLRDFGMVRADPDTGRIGLGLRFLEFARVLLEHMDIRQVAAPYLRRLSEMSGETTYLVMFETDRVVYVDKVESPHAVRLQPQVGATAPLHCSAPGKALLARMDPARVRALMMQLGMPQYTRQTITSLNDLEAQLRQIREVGYAIEDSEWEEGVRSVAACVSARHGPLAVAIAGPSFRLSLAELQRLGAYLTTVVREIGAQLNWEIGRPVGAPVHSATSSNTDGRSDRPRCPEGVGT